MDGTRDLDWQGCFNVRDLGGLPAAGGRRTARGSLVRADSLSRMSDAGWQALLDHGVRTVIDLRNERERDQAPDLASRPPEIETVAVAIDGIEDTAFWRPITDTPEFGTPLYYRAHLMRKPHLAANAVRAIARAAPGGVAFHCVGGRDRSGQVAMVALALVGVEPATIAADYELSHERLTGLWAALGEEDQAPALIAYLQERGTTAGEVIETTLASLDLEATLGAGGLAPEDLRALRERLLEPAGAGEPQ
ncbi:MAG: tyrosine-protein phosphatase [Solirubrobacteraceae bacterium]